MQGGLELIDQTSETGLLEKCDGYEYIVRLMKCLAERIPMITGFIVCDDAVHRMQQGRWPSVLAFGRKPKAIFSLLVHGVIIRCFFDRLPTSLPASAGCAALSRALRRLRLCWLFWAQAYGALCKLRSSVGITTRNGFRNPIHECPSRSLQRPAFAKATAQQADGHELTGRAEAARSA